MGDTTIYHWNAFRDSEGLPLCTQLMSPSVLKYGLSISSAYDLWIRQGGVISALNGESPLGGEAHVKEVARTVEWYENKLPFRYRSNFSKEELGQFDTFELDFGIPVGNSKVFSCLRAICPDDFEEIKLEIDTPTGVLSDYSIVNITKVCRPAVQWDASEYKFYGDGYFDDEGAFDPPSHFKHLRLIKDCLSGMHIARFHPSKRFVMLSSALFDFFRSESVYGLNAVLFEDYVSRR